MKNNPHRERPERTFARPHLSKLVVSFNNPMLLSVMCVASPSSEPFSELHCRTATASTTGQPDRRGLRTRDRLRLPVGRSGDHRTKAVAAHRNTPGMTSIWRLPAFSSATGCPTKKRRLSSFFRNGLSIVRANHPAVQ